MGFSGCFGFFGFFVFPKDIRLESCFCLFPLKYVRAGLILHCTKNTFGREKRGIEYQAQKRFKKTVKGRQAGKRNN